jgi:hypothetical protein
VVAVADAEVRPDPDGVEVVLPAIVYAKILEEHAAVADLGLIGRAAGSGDPAWGCACGSRRASPPFHQGSLPDELNAARGAVARR